MTLRACLLLMLAIVAAPVFAGPAQGAGCIALRVGYVDHHRPPYWLGDGERVAEPPGAAVDLIRDAVLGAGFGCTPTWVRLPAARLKVALAAGDIDLAPLSEQSFYPAGIALPRDKAGNIDLKRALHNQLLVLVRTGDQLPAGTDPMQYFKGKTLGIPMGNSYAARLREAGLTVDDGARDLSRNIEKLRLGRVDGVVVTAVSAAHLNKALSKYQGSIAQLRQPLLNTRLWLAFNDTFYRAHPRQAEALWSWLDTHHGRLGYVMQRYIKN
ncbi:hypothetical protein GTP38_15370 [Duganella sp. FT94W]|uniref:Transporter substrate-binding domain-containing protein n=1 Tax=Duganella lactea TaxID=2692173 RepID=A0ABW9V7V3_9BURK|nr:transporter substrate-binding domain-containing protein [Duganella lactea]MYM35713.1 hypothetical protein [Duganella lactea]